MAMYIQSIFMKAAKYAILKAKVNSSQKSPHMHEAAWLGEYDSVCKFIFVNLMSYIKL